MPKFRFRLQRVMEVKQHKEEEFKRALAQTQRVLKEEHRILETLQSEQNARFREAERRGVGEIRPVEMRLYSAYLTALAKRITDQQTTIEQLREEEEHKRSDLLEASKEKKILEGLRDRRYAAFRTEMDRAEQAFLDEVAQREYTRGLKPVPPE